MFFKRPRGGRAHPHPVYLKFNQPGAAHSTLRYFRADGRGGKLHLGKMACSEARLVHFLSQVFELEGELQTETQQDLKVFPFP